jgi:hypothetical protein
VRARSKYLSASPMSFCGNMSATSPATRVDFRLGPCLLSGLHYTRCFVDALPRLVGLTEFCLGTVCRNPPFNLATRGGIYRSTPSFALRQGRAEYQFEDTDTGVPHLSNRVYRWFGPAADPSRHLRVRQDNLPNKARGVPRVDVAESEARATCRNLQDRLRLHLQGLPWTQSLRAPAERR